MTDTTATQVAAVGDFVMARPWALGSELDPQVGIVVKLLPGSEALVWFRGKGLTGTEETGWAVQAFRNSELKPEGLNVTHDLGGPDVQALFALIAPEAGQPARLDFAELYALLYPIARRHAEAG